MHPACAIALILLPAISVTACGRGGDDGNPGIRDGVASAGKTPAAQSSGKDAGAAMRYTCQANTSVALLRDGSARVSLPDGTNVDLERIVGSNPTVFTGSSLYFTTGDHGARLSQQDGSNELACKLG
jgi:hypothetical protein